MRQVYGAILRAKSQVFHLPAFQMCVGSSDNIFWNGLYFYMKQIAGSSFDGTFQNQRLLLPTTSLRSIVAHHFHADFLEFLVQRGFLVPGIVWFYAFYYTCLTFEAGSFFWHAARNKQCLNNVALGKFRKEQTRIAA